LISDAVGGETTEHQRVGPDVSAPVMDGPLPFDRIGDGVGFDTNGVAYDLDTMAVKFSPRWQARSSPRRAAAGWR
jgi:hypothetical protein